MENLKHGYILRELHGSGEGQRRIYKPRPYDEASYYYALEIGGVWYIVNNNQLGGKRVDYDSLDDIVDELVTANSAITPRMCHN